MHFSQIFAIATLLVSLSASSYGMPVNQEHSVSSDAAPSVQGTNDLVDQERSVATDAAETIQNVVAPLNREHPVADDVVPTVLDTVEPVNQEPSNDDDAVEQVAPVSVPQGVTTADQPEDDGLVSSDDDDFRPSPVAKRIKSDKLAVYLARIPKLKQEKKDIVAKFESRRKYIENQIENAEESIADNEGAVPLIKSHLARLQQVQGGDENARHRKIQELLEFLLKAEGQLLESKSELQKYQKELAGLPTKVRKQLTLINSQIKHIRNGFFIPDEAYVFM